MTRLLIGQGTMYRDEDQRERSGYEVSQGQATTHPLPETLLVTERTP